MALVCHVVPLPTITLSSADAVRFVPPFATGSVPITPVVSGNPVAFVKVPDAGVPSAPPAYKSVSLEFGRVKVFSDVAGPLNFVKPFPVPPNVDAITCVSAAVPSKLFP